MLREELPQELLRALCEEPPQELEWLEEECEELREDPEREEELLE